MVGSPASDSNSGANANSNTKNRGQCTRRIDLSRLLKRLRTALLRFWQARRRDALPTSPKPVPRRAVPAAATMTQTVVGDLDRGRAAAEATSGCRVELLARGCAARPRRTLYSHLSERLLQPCHISYNQSHHRSAGTNVKSAATTKAQRSFSCWLFVHRNYRRPQQHARRKQWVIREERASRSASRQFQRGRREEGRPNFRGTGRSVSITRRTQRQLTPTWTNSPVRRGATSISFLKRTSHF
jgi:hypothetical protein